MLTGTTNKSDVRPHMQQILIPAGTCPKHIGNLEPIVKKPKIACQACQLLENSKDHKP